MSPLPAERLTLLVYVALGASFVLLAAVALLAYRLRAVRRTYARLLAGGGSGEDILAAVARQVEAVDRLRGKLKLSAINGRSETRSYAKPVRGGHSDHNLSDEERTAIALAMSRSAPVQREPV